MLTILTMFNNFFNNKHEERSADIAIKRLNELIAKLPTMSTADIEIFKQDMLSYLASEHGVDKNNVFFTVTGNDVCFTVANMVK